jgi:hypothetical protein
MTLLRGIPEGLANLVRQDLTRPNPDFKMKDGLTAEERALADDRIRLWMPHPDGTLVPRYYWRPELAAYGEIEVVRGDVGDFDHVLRFGPLPHQVEVAEEFARWYGDIGLRAKCGWGKTWAGFYRIAQGRGRGLIIVPNNNKMAEWRKDACNYLGLEPRQVGTIQGAKRDWLDKPVTVAMAKTLALQKFSPEEEGAFETTVLDECLATGTLIDMGDGSRRAIENIQVGDLVHTPIGARRVAATKRSVGKMVFRVETSCGKVLFATENHLLGGHPNAPTWLRVGIAAGQEIFVRRVRKIVRVSARFGRARGAHSCGAQVPLHMPEVRDQRDQQERLGAQIPVPTKTRTAGEEGARLVPRLWEDCHELEQGRTRDDLHAACASHRADDEAQPHALGGRTRSTPTPRLVAIRGWRYPLRSWCRWKRPRTDVNGAAGKCGARAHGLPDAPDDQHACSPGTRGSTSLQAGLRPLELPSDRRSGRVVTSSSNPPSRRCSEDRVAAGARFPSLTRPRPPIRDAECLRLAADGGLGRSTVLSVTYAGVADVFDLEVESAACFFAEGILVHNCHLMQASVISKCLGKFGGSRMALSATPGKGLRRELTELHYGPRWLAPKSEEMPVRVEFLPVVVWEKLRRADWQWLRTMVGRDINYAAVGAKVCRQLMDQGRRVLVLGNQIDPLARIYRDLGEAGGFVCGHESIKELSGQFGTVRSALEARTEKSWPRRCDGYMDDVKLHANPILGTGVTATQPAGTGMDVKTLDGGVILLPIAKRDTCVQVLGRFQRVHPNKQSPLVVVLVPDTHAGHDAAKAMAAHLSAGGAEVIFHAAVGRL